MNSHILLSSEEMYAIIELVRKANRNRGVPVSTIWNEIIIFATSQNDKK
jgi:hypothetical protein